MTAQSDLRGDDRQRGLPLSPALLAVAGALLTGLVLRLWGIQWGFPRVDLSPDELNVWNISARLSWHDP
ncbi:MAG TPA: hypothetical protein PKK12_07610, partial [Candidatus Aminicenantes bacterium]|nr:hypothetical protein [Candidatus Aminicenantes bacterium]